MAKSDNSREEKNPSFGKKEQKMHIVWALAFLVAGILTAVALWDYDWHQNSDFQNPPTGTEPLVGTVGLFFSAQSLSLLGRSAWILPAWMLWMSGMLFSRQSRKLILGRYIAWVGLFFSLPVLFTLLQNYMHSTYTMFKVDGNYYSFGFGGWIGHIFYDGFLHKTLGSLGTMVIFGAMLGVCVVFVFFDNLGIILRRLALWMWANGRNAYDSTMGYFAQRKTQKEDLEMRRRQAALERAEAIRQAREEALNAQQEADAKAEKEASDKEKAEEPEEENESSADDEPSAEEAAEKQETPVSEESSPKIAQSGLRIVHEELPKKAELAQPQKKGNYEFPTLDLLAVPPPPPLSDDANVHQQMADQLVRTLAEFGVKVTMGEVHPGPVITRYDLYPAAGVRVEKIQNLEKNLALALCAMSVRILAPVPGKGCVGVEIPNKQPQSVFIRDILESEDWVKCKAEIPIALGKEVSGKPLVADLTKMPHMLIAGATGSGKTVCINAIVASLLYKMSPDDLRFVMVDPKIVEMQVYNGLPHMLIPVVTDPKKVPGALKYLINEMERRYRLFASVGVRNIAGYNAKRTKDKESEDKAKELEAALSPEERAAAAQAANISVPRELDFENGGTPPEKLPYIVCIVDELADLMMVAPADVETGIARLAQLARAAGIHLIIATQRPSVNVITGIIKANLPSRIAFKVASKVDSRTILDYGGADQLIGRGDMLFMPPGIAELIRSQGAFVADEEINKIVDFVNQHNGEPEFDEEFQKSVEESAMEGDSEGEDEDEENSDALIPDALEVIRTTSRASTSMLQRRLRIGYNRAARIMEILEARGYVGPENGSMPREILRDLNQDKDA
jgi:DNA segregation ATPase FtsK/SpoIIIE, S-DNA-T family